MGWQCSACLCVWDTELTLLLHTHNGSKMKKGKKSFIFRAGCSDLPCLAVGREAFDLLLSIFQCS